MSAAAQQVRAEPVRGQRRSAGCFGCVSAPSWAPGLVLDARLEKSNRASSTLDTRHLVSSAGPEGTLSHRAVRGWPCGLQLASVGAGLPRRSPHAPMQVAPILEPQIVPLRPNYLCDPGARGFGSPKQWQRQRECGGLSGCPDPPPGSHPGPTALALPSPHSELKMVSGHFPEAPALVIF